MSNDSTYTDNSGWLFDFLFRNLRHLIYIGLVALVVSFCAALLLPSKYRATVVLFPATTEPVSKSLLGDNQNVKGLLNFGTADEVEQFLQVLYSDNIRTKIIQKYHLFSHYDIDSLGKYPYTKLYRKYEDNISFRSTEYFSIEIEVFDKVPEIAARIANDIADFADSTINQMQHERAQKAFCLVRNEYNIALRDLDFIQDSLAKLRELGIFDYDAQSEVYSDAYASAIAKGNKEGVKDLDEKFKVLAKFGGTFKNFSEMVINETKRISQLKQKYVEAKMDAEQDIPHKYIVSKAEVPEKEFYPIRWLVVLGSILSALVFGALVLSMMEQLKKKVPEIKIPTIPLKQIIQTDLQIVLFNYDNMEAYFKNKGLIEMVTRWKTHLGIIVVLSALLGIFISSPMMITPMFKSMGIVYPVNISRYSEESNTEQMVQIMNSNDIAIKMLKSFDLGTHYKINKNNPQFYTMFMGEYNDNVSINKTEYESIQIKVLDKDPVIACHMVDSIIAYADQKIASLHKIKHMEAYRISKGTFERKSRELDSLENLQKEIRKTYGILNYSAQSSEATKGELAGSNQAKELFKNLQEKGIEYQRLDSLVWYARRDYLYFKNSTETELTESSKKITYSQVVSAPIISDKKAYPVRWAIILITILSTLVFSLIVISFIDSKRKTD